MTREEFNKIQPGDIISANTDKEYLFTTKSDGWVGKVISKDSLYIEAETIKPLSLKQKIFSRLYYGNFNLEVQLAAQEEEPDIKPLHKREIPQLTNEKVLAVFKDIDNPEHTTESKIVAVNVVANTAALNAYTKAQLINSIKWLYANCDIQPKGGNE
ncbi:MAG: hypothetical protein LUD19_01245 [Clostridia bacterium]|nr:hypothetical protein [Clostridia bacterium]